MNKRLCGQLIKAEAVSSHGHTNTDITCKDRAESTSWILPLLEIEQFRMQLFTLKGSPLTNLGHGKPLPALRTWLSQLHIYASPFLGKNSVHVNPSEGTQALESQLITCWCPQDMVQHLRRDLQVFHITLLTFLKGYRRKQREANGGNHKQIARQ